MQAVILAAGTGSRLRPLTENLPKGLIEIEGKTLIERSLDALNAKGIHDVTIVIGFKGNQIKDKIGHNYKDMQITYVQSGRFEETGSMYSFYLTKNKLTESVILLESDLLYETKALDVLLASKFSNVILTAELLNSGDDVYICTDENSRLTRLGKNISAEDKQRATGCLVGISKLSPEFLIELFTRAEMDFASNNFLKHYEETIFETNIVGTPVYAELCPDLHWTEIDNANDLALAREKIIRQINNAPETNQPELPAFSPVTREKTGWDLLWEKKGMNALEFDPIKLDGFDSGAGDLNEFLIKKIVDKIITKLKLQREDSLLEVGCGAGMLLIPLSNHVNTIAGIDLSNSLISLLRAHLPQANLVVSGADTLPFATGAFNKILVHSIMHYFPSLKYAEKALLEMVRVCNVGGKILLMDIPDLDKKQANDEFRQRTCPAKIADPTLQHLFYDKKFLIDFCNDNNLNFEIWDQDVPNYSNSQFRFNILIHKN